MDKAATLAVLLALTACAHSPSPRDSADSLAAAEAAFAAHSVREDMRAAFLAHFADDGLFVRDGWTVARPWLEARPAPAIVLEWRPVYVEVAASGDLGLSTGPWRATPRGDAKGAAAHGQFVSIWKRAPGGPWKVAVDLGISHPGAALWDAPLQASTAARGGASGSLEAAEAAFARDCALEGERAAYRAHGSAGLRRYREGFEPRASLAAALAASGEARLAWSPRHVEAARSADLGYAIGSYSDAAAPAAAPGTYLRAWRREDGGWKIVLDVINAAPKR